MYRFGSLVGALLLAAGAVLGSGGAAQAASPLNPVGNLDGVSYNGRLVVNGWTFDPETAAPIDVHAYVDNRLVSVATAERQRPDVATVYPSYGSRHGYSLDLGTLSTGVHSVCVFAINVGVGDANPLLGCRSLTVAGQPALNPVGGFDEAALIPAGLYLTGWTFDPETPAPIDVHVYVDGRLVQVTTADRERPDIAATFPSYGSRHGFRTVVQPPLPGRHQVCLYAINVGGGTTNPSLGCRDFTVSAFNFGATATLSTGIAVTVQKPVIVPVSESALPTLIAGNAGVLLTVTLTNTTNQTFTPFEDVFLDHGPVGLEADLVFDVEGSNPDNVFEGRVPPGSSRSATFLYQVPYIDLDNIRVEVFPDVGDESAFFVGTI